MESFLSRSTELFECGGMLREPKGIARKAVASLEHGVLVDTL